jgi:SpoVK/Ycf46/Vps4 family AAA+-type ATPase
MALIEDVDAVFNGRENVAQRDRQYLTFDCLLNCIDGIERVDGLFVVITTNRPEHIDPALGGQSDGVGSTRPGRIDRVLELRPLDEAGRRKMASRILPDFPGEWERLIRDGAGDSGAQFQERCARHAISLHYRQAKVRTRNGSNGSGPRRFASAGSGSDHESTSSAD